MKTGLLANPAYMSWRSMRQRCRDPNSPDYQWYGGRGITFCPEWETFDGFFRDMGPRPPGMTLDRIDSDGNYEPANCRWADLRTQNWNRRHLRFLEAFGERKRLVEWLEDERCMVGPSTLRQRLYKQLWEPQRAISTPPQPRPARAKTHGTDQNNQA